MDRFVPPNSRFVPPNSAASRFTPPENVRPIGPPAKSLTNRIAIPILPRFKTYSFGFFGTRGGGAGTKGIVVPNGFNAGSSCGWYPLLNIQPDQDDGQQVGLFAVAGSILPTHSDAVSPDQQWGLTSGCNAAIVLGVDLPINGGGSTGTTASWNIAPCPLPGVSGEGAQSLTAGRFLWWMTFPPGSYADTTPLKAFTFESMAPYVADIPNGRPIQAALVVAGLANASGAAQNLCGAVSIRAVVGQTQPVGDYGSTS